MNKNGWMLFGALCFAPLATAQNTAQNTAQSPGPARGDIAPSALRDAALTVARAVDAGQAAQLWQSASSVTRQTLQQPQFVASVTQARKPYTQPVQRQWTGVTLRDVSTQTGAATPGRYGSVDFVTTFAGNRRAHELVSFRLDEDGQWRFAGYVVEGLR